MEIPRERTVSGGPEQPLQPMLARLARDLPLGDYLYEPKWDGFRCLAFHEGDEIDLRSRNRRPLARYFPEVVEALLALPEQRFVLDGELVVAREEELDFAALMARLHPAASRVRRLRHETPASLVAFDLLAVGDDDLLVRPFAEARPARGAARRRPSTARADSRHGRCRARTPLARPLRGRRRQAP